MYTYTHLEMHIPMCDFIEKNKLFSRPIQEAFAQIPEKERPMPILKCPLLPVSFMLTLVYTLIKEHLSWNKKNVLKLYFRTSLGYLQYYV